MRTHSQIISDAGGPANVAREGGFDEGNVKSWKRLNSIPAPYWTAFVVAGMATLRELANAVAKPLPDGRVVHLESQARSEPEAAHA